MSVENSARVAALDASFFRGQGLGARPSSRSVPAPCTTLAHPYGQDALEKETKEMMQTACASPTVGKDPLFTVTCSKLHTEL